MKNKNKLIIANVFAFMAVLILLVGTKLLGLEFGFSAEEIIPTALLLTIPQLGFFYMYWMSFRLEKSKLS
jgi:ABC-type long-subunit fatty acid transport system fused permease/ATPase subunit